MLFNKNFYRKAGDKKVLHKVGKQWKVVSVALLMAIGGGAAVAATNNNASANATDNAYNDAPGVTSNVAEQAEQLENNNYYGGSASASVAPKSASKVTVAPKKANISYAPSEYYVGNNASAASYKNNEAFDKAEINYYGPIVRGYVDAVNAKYPEAVSLENNYNDLKGKTANEQSTANSYSATYANSNTANVISAKASAAGQTTSYYTDSVAYRVLGNGNDNGYINDVRNDASLASEESVVASGVSLVSAIHNSRILSTEYHNSYALAKASANADATYANDESEIANDVTSNSSINQNDLTSAQTTLSTLAINASVANINSGVDSRAVSSLASSAGFSFGNSSVVSSAISNLATNYNPANSYVEDNATSSLSDLKTYQASVNTNIIYFSANGQTKDANGNTSEASVAIGGPNTFATLSQAMSNNSGVSTNPQASNYAVASTGFDFVRVVSDTNAQQQYAKYAGSLESEISKDQASVSAYNLEVSSAQSAANSAATKASDASDAAAKASYLAGDGVHQYSVSLGDIFGTTTNSSATAQYYNDQIANASLSSNDYFSAKNNGSVFNYEVSFANYLISSAATANGKSDANSLSDYYKGTGFFANQTNNASTAANDVATYVGKAFTALTKGGKETNAEAVASSALTSAEAGGQSLNNKSDMASLASAELSVAAANVKAQGNDGAQDLVNGFSSSITYPGSDNATNNLITLGNNFSAVASAVVSNAASVATSTNLQQPSNVAGLYDANSNDANNYALAAGSLAGYLNLGDSSAVSGVESAANTATSNYKLVSSESASYAKATDQDVTISSQFASYFNSLASSDADATNAAKQSMDNFISAHAANGYASASDAYTSASANEPNDRDFAYAYGKNVLLNSPEYITVTKNAMLHSDTQYAKSNSVESVKAGTQFAVKGVGFDMAGNVRFVVADKNGKNLYLTANDQYFKPTYLAPSVDYTVTLAKGAVAHNTLAFHKDAEGTIPANTQLEGYTVPTSTNSGRRDAAYGVTRLQVKGGKFNGDYITTNCKYFSNVTENNSDNSNANAEQNANPVQHTINFAD